MLHFRMNMPFYLMAFYGSVMIAAVLLLRALLKNKLPKFVFPALWGVVLLRLLVPFSLSSPLSLPVPAGLTGLSESMAIHEDETTWVAEDLPQTQSGTAGSEATGGDGTAHTWASESPDVPGTDNDTAVVEEGVMEGSSGYVMDTGTSFLPRSFFPGNNSLGSDSLRNALPALYLLGLAVVAGILAWQKIIYAKRLKGGLLMERNETVNGLLRDMGMGHVLVFSNDEIASPLAYGLIGPRIYLPTRMDFGNAVLLRHVLAHEAMHIRRRDNWVKAVMLAAVVLHWYNPLVWLMAKCLASDLEAACDAAVLKKYDTDQRKSYAYSLLAMAVSASRSSLLYSAFQGGREAGEGDSGVQESLGLCIAAFRIAAGGGHGCLCHRGAGPFFPCLDQLLRQLGLQMGREGGNHPGHRPGAASPEAGGGRSVLRAGRGRLPGPGHHPGGGPGSAGPGIRRGAERL